MANNKAFMANLSTFIASITIILMIIFMPCATPLCFNLSTFNPNGGAVEIQGDASISGGEILLTKDRQDQDSYNSTGRAVYKEALHLWDNASGRVTDFTTCFAFAINSQNKTPYADGMAFFLAPTDLPFPGQPDGSGFGLLSGEQVLNSTEFSFVAVEFDTYQNTNLHDPDCDHVGINVNSVISRAYVPWNSSIKDGKENHVKITYDSASKNLSVTFTGYGDDISFEQHLSFVVDLKRILPEFVTFGFSASTGKSLEIHTLKSWYFTSTLEMMSSSEHGKSSIELVAVLIVCCAFLLLCGLGFIWYSLNKIMKSIDKGDISAATEMSMDEDFERETRPRKFSYDELVRATNNFAEEEKLGQGGFGGVYRGVFRELNMCVAVKRISEWSRQGKKEYASEVKIISRLRHKNLVQLVGWCHERRGLLLVYEFMSNGSLDVHLFKHKNVLLSWMQRIKIVQGLASALLYLHEEWEQCVVHRDIKSSNIMLDSNFNAKLGDFGLARLVDHEKGSQTTVLAGTLGYIAPECALTGKASKESDVYSFGVVALEIACGRKPFNPDADERKCVLIEWVWELYGTRKLFEAADPRLGRDYNDQQMEQLMIVGLWCAYPDYKIRPSMKQALQVLNGEAPLPVLPSTMPVPSYLHESAPPEICVLPSCSQLNISSRSLTRSPILPR